MGVSIEIGQLIRSFGSEGGVFTALGPVDLSVAPGEFVSVLGPSGCGKSTLMLAVAGLVRETSGKVLVDHRVVTRPLTDIGIAFQDHLLLEFRTSVENVLLQAEIRHLDKTTSRRRALDLLTQLGVDHARDRYPAQLSGGMRQRVAIARALIHEPSLLLMDEPLGALDAITRTQVRHDLERVWLGSHATVLFVTHSIEEAVSLSDRVIVMTPGPGRVAEDLKIDIPRPRSLLTPGDEKFRGYVDHLYRLFESLGVFNTTGGVPGASGSTS